MHGEMELSYETLFELLRNERSRAELQEVQQDFMERVSMFIQAEIYSAGQAPDSKKEESRVRSIYKILEEIDDRRTRKLVILALNSSKTSSVITDYDKFLPHEREMFDTIIKIFLNQREVMKELSAKIPQKNEGIAKDEQKKVRFISPVPKFIGPELEEYGPFGEMDTADLPSKIADILVSKKRAEEI